MYLFPNTVKELHEHLSKIKRMISVEKVMPSVAQFLTLSVSKVTYTPLMKNSVEFNEILSN